MTALLEVSDLRKYFPADKKRQLHALDDIDFKLQPGASIGIVGESGSGKSTLARLISRLDDPTAGRILFEDEDISAVPQAKFIHHSARRNIQLVFQDPSEAMNPTFSVARNIAIGLGRTFPTAADMKKVDSMAEQVGLSAGQLARKPHELSGGQQARAGIARAMISEPKLLILDEPTASLDVSVQAIILKLINELRHQHQIALLFVSHDLDVVRLMCDEVMVLYLGRILEFGPARQTLADPKHPYTQALLAATPGHGIPIVLKGEPASPINPSPAICNFASRCPLANEQCHLEKPLLRPLDGQMVACHLADNPISLTTA